MTSVSPLFLHERIRPCHQSFSGDGKVSDDFWLNDDCPYRVVIQPDGKILIGGNESGVSYSVLRLNPDGSPDTSFGGAGVGRAHAALGWGVRHGASGRWEDSGGRGAG